MYFSIGGGFVVDEEEAGRNSRGSEDEVSLPFPFTSGADLLAMGAASGKSFADMMLDNERAHRGLAEVEAGIDAIPAAMDASVDAGHASPGHPDRKSGLAGKGGYRLGELRGRR